MCGGGLWIQRLKWKVLQLGKTKGRHHVKLGERLQSQFISKASWRNQPCPHLYLSFQLQSYKRRNSCFKPIPFVKFSRKIGTPKLITVVCALAKARVWQYYKSITICVYCVHILRHESLLLHPHFQSHSHSLCDSPLHVHIWRGFSATHLSRSSDHQLTNDLGVAMPFI